MSDKQTIKLREKWVIQSIDEIATISTGKKDANHATEDGKYKFYTCAFKPLMAPTFSFEDEAIILPGNGHNVGEVFYFKGMFEAYQRTYVLHKIKVDPKYLFYQLKLGWKKATAEKQYGSATNYIRIGNFTDYSLLIAPPEQQKQIVAKIEQLFSHIDAGVEALNTAKQYLKQYRQSVLKAAVTGELTKEWREAHRNKLNTENQLLELVLDERNSEYSRKLTAWEKALEEWQLSGEQGKKPTKPQKIKVLNGFSSVDLRSFGLLPKNWRWVKLGNLAVDVFDGPFGSNLKSSDYVEKGVRVIRLENIGNLEFNADKVTYVSEEKYEALKKHRVSKGDIIFSSFVVDGTRVVVLPTNIEKAINKADCFCIRTFGDSIGADYLAYFLSTTSTYKRLENQVHGATRPRINTTQLKELEVPICSAQEQLEIVRIIREKLESIDRLDNEIGVLLQKEGKNKQSILASAFSGKLITASTGTEL
ncbi:MAG: hypothetical protein GQ532_08210 [Methylomarinum sp.]|nr:hypothetical protein [Methylomarinum sp.]